MNRYEIAIEEYESSEDDGKHKLIYAYFGLAIYFSQVLEETFSIMLWTDRIFKKKVKSNKEVNEIIDAIENSKKTMGVFINEVKQTYSLPEQLIESLKKVLEKRNYIVHKYFKLEIQKIASDLGKREMLQYFCSFIDNVKEIDEELNKYYLDYKLRLGITEETIDQLVKEMKEEELERELKINSNK
ncbi:hypothetical protein [Aquimarina rubra]|uniref:Uncharacterized protein n=1 Tax=Aquimarina rubra TaxID=1920033 RepID=A0ABW5LFU5_9FLAO